jgi:lipoprotein-releasing system permease protein
MQYLFAWRYFKGKKSTQAVQIISWVSVLAMAVATAALIIVLSVFNGFEGFIQNLYSSFYTPIKISSTKGHTFQLNDEILQQIKNTKGVDEISMSLEHKVLLAFENNQIVATLKGVDTIYKSITHLDDKIQSGVYSINSNKKYPSILLGVGLSNKLGADEEAHIPIKAYSFKDNQGNFLNPDESYNTAYLAIEGVYMLQEDIDSKYAFAPLETVQALLEKNGMISSIEISTRDGMDAEEVQQQLSKIITPSSGLKAETRFEQNRTLNFILSSERWFVFAFLVFILVIASFNIVGALSMLVIDKEKDIRILKAMGMTQKLVQTIFLYTGILLALVGAGIGCLFAFIICSLQQQFGFIKLGNGDSFLIKAYPVDMNAGDFVTVFIIVFILAAIASIVPSIKAGKRYELINLK